MELSFAGFFTNLFSPGASPRQPVRAADPARYVPSDAEVSQRAAFFGKHHDDRSADRDYEIWWDSLHDPRQRKLATQVWHDAAQAARDEAARQERAYLEQRSPF